MKQKILACVWLTAKDQDGLLFHKELFVDGEKMKEGDSGLYKKTYSETFHLKNGDIVETGFLFEDWDGVDRYYTHLLGLSPFQNESGQKMLRRRLKLEAEEFQDSSYESKQESMSLKSHVELYQIYKESTSLEKKFEQGFWELQRLIELVTTQEERVELFKEVSILLEKLKAGETTLEKVRTVLCLNSKSKVEQVKAVEKSSTKGREHRYFESDDSFYRKKLIKRWKVKQGVDVPEEMVEWLQYGFGIGIINWELLFEVFCKPRFVGESVRQEVSEVCRCEPEQDLELKSKNEEKLLSNLKKDLLSGKIEVETAIRAYGMNVVRRSFGVDSIQLKNLIVVPHDISPVSRAVVFIRKDGDLHIIRKSSVVSLVIGQDNLGCIEYGNDCLYFPLNEGDNVEEIKSLGMGLQYFTLLK